MKPIEKFLRDRANEVEAAGDSVGPNDMDLANRLWQAASDLRKYAKQAQERWDRTGTG